MLDITLTKGGNMKRIIALVFVCMLCVSFVYAQSTLTVSLNANQPQRGWVTVPVPGSNTYTTVPYTVYPQHQTQITYGFDSNGNVSTNVDNGLWNLLIQSPSSDASDD